MRSIKWTYAAVLPIIMGFLLAFSFVGCYNVEQSPTAPTPIPEEEEEEEEEAPASLFLSGQCRAGGLRIECEDNSTSNPRGSLALIRMVLRNSISGVTVEQKSVSPGTLPPRELAFSGLVPGTYEVRHEIVALDGGASSTIYGNLFVQ